MSDSIGAEGRSYKFRAPWLFALWGSSMILMGFLMGVSVYHLLSGVQPLKRSCNCPRQVQLPQQPATTSPTAASNKSTVITDTGQDAVTKQGKASPSDDYEDPPWWRQPHPLFEKLITKAPAFPQATPDIKARAVDCLRAAFGTGVPRDMLIYSQWGEDGIIEAVFKCIGVTSKTYVEFGTESGEQCSTRWLREAHGFSGLLMDGFHENPEINLHKELICAETISDLLHKYSVPFPTLDHMTIDIDYNTFHVTAAVLQGGWRPRSLIIEFNRNFLPHQSFTVLYGKARMWEHDDCYYGASALSLQRLAGFYGYQLVAVDIKGINLFFVHNTTLGEGTEEVHANTPTKDHPAHQVWPFIHNPCVGRTWLEIPSDVDWNNWAPAMAKHTKLLHRDRHDFFRIFYKVLPEDSVKQIPGLTLKQRKAAHDDRALAEFERYKPESHTMHDEPTTHEHSRWMMANPGKPIKDWLSKTD